MCENNLVSYSKSDTEISIVAPPHIYGAPASVLSWTGECWFFIYCLSVFFLWRLINVIYILSCFPNEVMVWTYLPKQFCFICGKWLASVSADNMKQWRRVFLFCFIFCEDNCLLINQVPISTSFSPHYSWLCIFMMYGQLFIHLSSVYLLILPYSISNILWY